MLIASINQLNLQQKNDSAESIRFRNIKTTDRILGLNYIQPILVSINNSNGVKSTYDKGLSFSLDYMTIPKNNRIGWGLSVDINEMNYNLSSNDNIVETLPWELYVNDTTHMSFIHAKNIKEIISISDMMKVSRSTDYSKFRCDVKVCSYVLVHVVV